MLSLRPEGAKASDFEIISRCYAFALSGRFALICFSPRALPWAGSRLRFQRAIVVLHAFSIVSYVKILIFFF